jgi:hypothetical protein
MKMISKEVFVDTIECIRKQIVCNDLGENIFKTKISKNPSNVKFFDTIKLIRSTIKLLEIFFPKDENNFSEIEHYIFFCNFGKPNIDSEYESPGALYDRLIK